MHLLKFIALILFVVNLTVLAGCQSNEKSESDSNIREVNVKYEFFLNGERYYPEIIPVFGIVQRPVEGDVANVDGLRFVLDKPGIYNLRLDTENHTLFREYPNGKSTILSVCLIDVTDDDYVDPLKDLTDEGYKKIRGLIFRKVTDVSIDKLKKIDPRKTFVEFSTDDPEEEEITQIGIPQDLAYLSLGDSKLVERYYDEIAKLDSLLLFFMDSYSYFLNSDSEWEFDLSFLAKSKDLRALKIQSRFVKNENMISKCTKLKSLEFGGNMSITDYSFIKNLRSLEQFNLIFCKEVDLSVIKKCTKLETMDLRYTDISSFPSIKQSKLKSIICIGSNAISVEIQKFMSVNQNCAVIDTLKSLLMYRAKECDKLLVGPIKHCCTPLWDEAVVLDKNAIEEFLEAVEFVEDSDSITYCMCCGTHFLDFRHEDKSALYLSYHHEQSFRDLVLGDAHLTESSVEKVKKWFEKYVNPKLKEYFEKQNMHKLPILTDPKLLTEK